MAVFTKNILAKTCLKRCWEVINLLYALLIAHFSSIMKIYWQHTLDDTAIRDYSMLNETFVHAISIKLSSRK